MKKYIAIDPCYFNKKGKYENLNSFYGKACRAGGDSRERMKAFEFEHYDTTCYVGSTANGDGFYHGCAVDSGQIALVPSSLAKKLEINVSTEMFKELKTETPGKTLEAILGKLNFEIGDEVEHRVFKVGVIAEVDSERDRVLINFKTVGHKWLVVEYANLRKFN